MKHAIELLEARANQLRWDFHKSRNSVQNVKFEADFKQVLEAIEVLQAAAAPVLTDKVTRPARFIYNGTTGCFEQNSSDTEADAMASRASTFVELAKLFIAKAYAISDVYGSQAEYGRDRGIGDMTWKDWKEFDCTSPEHYIYNSTTSWFETMGIDINTMTVESDADATRRIK